MDEFKRGFLYDIVLNNGKEVKCFSKNRDEVLEMILTHSIFIVRENAFPDKVAYIMPEKVSYFRFDNSVGGEPV